MKRFQTENFNYQHLKIDKPTDSEYYHNHMHNGYELLYFLGGDAKIVINASTYQMKKRDFFLMHSGTFHALFPNPEVPYERICIHFSEKTLPAKFRSLLPSLRSVYHIHKYSVIDNLFSSLLQYEYDFAYSNEEMIYLTEQAITNIIVHLKHLESETPLRPTESNQLLNDIIDYIDENITKPLNIEILSKMFFRSQSWIAHNFAETLNIPIQTYINNKKIIYAQSLISVGIPPTQVATQLSFTNYSTFYKAYKKFLGSSPMEDLPQ